MTERPESKGARVDLALRILRRAAHALRNAQNAAVVNLEVVRSRSAAGAVTDSVKQFTDNAARGIDDAARLGEALLAICTALISALAEDTLLATEDDDGKRSRLELGMKPEEAGALTATVRAAGEGLGIYAETSARGAILRIPRENEAS